MEVNCQSGLMHCRTREGLGNVLLPTGYTACSKKDVYSSFGTGKSTGLVLNDESTEKGQYRLRNSCTPGQDFTDQAIKALTWQVIERALGVFSKANDGPPFERWAI